MRLLAHPYSFAAPLPSGCALSALAHSNMKIRRPFASRRVRILLYSVSSQCHTATRFYRDSATLTTTQLNRYSQTPRLSDSLDSQIPRCQDASSPSLVFI